MIWALDLDDFTGNFCGEGPYPLLKRLNDGVAGQIPTQGPTTTRGP